MTEAHRDHEHRSFRDTIQHHSKSFSFASALIPGPTRRDVEVLYAWCRRADDAIDLAPPEERRAALETLRVELDAIYDGVRCDDDLSTAMQRLVREFRIPRSYPEELLEGMAMDVRGTDYQDSQTLLLYCFRVAGTVGLMMSHVLGVREPEALPHAVHLGIAMQLTNICRDVREDWENGRLYIPHDLLARHGDLPRPTQHGGNLPVQHHQALGDSVRELLDLADVYYTSGERGLPSLSWRAALAVRSARMIYAEIGTVIRRTGCDVLAPRAFVPRSRKYGLGLKALALTTAELPSRRTHRFTRAALTTTIRFPGDVVILGAEEQGQDTTRQS